jgi:hypothetical protein
VLFAVPNNGAELARAGNLISWRQWQLKQLSRESEFLGTLNEDWVTMKISEALQIKYVAGLQDRVVNRSSAQLYVGNRDLETVDRGHIDIVKPTSADDDAVLILENFLLERAARGQKPPLESVVEVSGAGRSTALDAKAPVRLEFSFDRNAAENFWYTYDADDNRNVTLYARNRRWSYSVFQIMPRIISSYGLTIHAVDATAYNHHLEHWIALEDSVYAGLAGPGLAKAVADFQSRNPAFMATAIRENESKAIKVAKIGVFGASLSAEFTFRPSLWGGNDATHYACVYFVCHVNTRYLFFACLLPEMSHYPAPVYFIGAPEILDVNDKAHFEALGASYLKSIATLPKLERLIVPGSIE